MPIKPLLVALIASSCLPFKAKIKQHDDETPVALRVSEEKLVAYLADRPVELASASLIVNNVARWLELTDDESKVLKGEDFLFIASEPLTLTTSLTFKDHHQFHSCSSKDLPLAGLIAGEDSSLTHNDCSHSSEAPELIYAQLEYNGKKLARYNLLRQIRELSCTIYYNDEFRTLTIDSRVSRQVTGHYQFTKEGGQQMFELSCSLDADALGVPTRKETSPKSRWSTADPVCVKFGDDNLLTWNKEHIKVSTCENDFDLKISFTSQLPVSPGFAEKDLQKITVDSELRDVKMLVKCRDGCLPATADELFCKIDIGSSKCFGFHLKRGSAFYGEFSLCGRSKVKEVGQDLHLRCNNTTNKKSASLALTPEILTTGKICLRAGTDLKFEDGNECVSKIEISFFK